MENNLNKEEIKKLLEKSGYSEKAINYYLEKVNVGTIEDADEKILYTGPCGDTMQFSLKIEGKIIKDIKFRAIGCAGAYCSGSALTVLVKGKTLEEAKSLTQEDIEKHLGNMPQQKTHCIFLSLKSLKRAIEDYEKKSNE